MGTYSFEATMPMALHPNSYLDSLISTAEDAEGGTFKIKKSETGNVMYISHENVENVIKGVASKIPLFEYTEKPGKSFNARADGTDKIVVIKDNDLNPKDMVGMTLKVMEVDNRNNIKTLEGTTILSIEGETISLSKNVIGTGEASFQIPKSFDITENTTEGRISIRPIRWKNPQHSVIMNRNTTLWLSRQQKKHSVGLPYKQPKRAVVMSMFEIYSSLTLLSRDEGELPSKFKKGEKSKLVIEEIKSDVIGSKEQQFHRLPLLKLLKKKGYYQVDGSDKYVWLGMEIYSGPSAHQGRANFNKSFEKQPDYFHGIGEEEKKSRLKLQKVELSKPYSYATMLRYHDFAYHRMMVDSCERCGVEKGKPCSLENLDTPREILRHSDKIHYADRQVSEFFNSDKGKTSKQRSKKKAIHRKEIDRCERIINDGKIYIHGKWKTASDKDKQKAKQEIESHKNHLQRMKDDLRNLRRQEKPVREFLEHYYTYCNVYTKPNSEDDLWKGWDKKRERRMTEAQAEKLWTDWDDEYRKHALEAIGCPLPKVPFSCESRLKIEEHMVETTFSKILEAGLNPLTLRKNSSKPNEGKPNRYFGGEQPPSLTVQNLWIDLLKRTLSSKLREEKQQDRLGVKGIRGRNQDKLLWECLADNNITTTKIDESYNPKEQHTLDILGLENNQLCKLDQEAEPWKWSDDEDWENNQGKLPIVSMNTSLDEISQLFLSEELPGLVISIDQWYIDGDDESAYEYSKIDEEYGISQDRFSEEEKKGARTFATFLKRVIETSNTGVLSRNVTHTRRAYGVLLREHFNPISDE